MELSAADLREAAAGMRDVKAARRALARALVLQGRSREEAAKSCAMDRQTLRDRVHRDNASGLRSRFDQARCNGSLPPLSAEWQAEVAK
jgi:transposase